MLVREVERVRRFQIVEGRLDTTSAIPVELPPGGAMFFSGMLPHQTPPNSSPQRRRAIQFHFHSKTARALPREEFDAVFVDEDGAPASCHAAEKPGDTEIDARSAQYERAYRMQSSVPALTRLNTNTSRVWPMRWTR